jgi:hypothetical protein
VQEPVHGCVVILEQLSPTRVAELDRLRRRADGHVLTAAPSRWASMINLIQSCVWPD